MNKPKSKWICADGIDPNKSGLFDWNNLGERIRLLCYGYPLFSLLCTETQCGKKKKEMMAQTLSTPLAPSLSLISNNGFISKSISKTVSFPAPKVHGLSIKCVRVGGVEIPNNKRIEYSLQYIHGVGRSRARQILCDINMDNKVTKDLSEEELITLRDEVSKYMIEGDLRRFNAINIKRLKDIQCYRGIRHIQGLPCRGQRTKNNCRTLKGKKVAIAGKKKK
ncbi:Ribosomal protein S13 [Sesbania bispinosa]|nr:Ribosomal protein S13 [Sesbania bispinosa]